MYLINTFKHKGKKWKTTLHPLNLPNFLGLTNRLWFTTTIEAFFRPDTRMKRAIASTVAIRFSIFHDCRLKKSGYPRGTAAAIYGRTYQGTPDFDATGQNWRIRTANTVPTAKDDSLETSHAHAGGEPPAKGRKIMLIPRPRIYYQQSLKQQSKSLTGSLKEALLNSHLILKNIPPDCWPILSNFASLRL